MFRLIKIVNIYVEIETLQKISFQFLLKHFAWSDIQFYNEVRLTKLIVVPRRNAIICT